MMEFIPVSPIQPLIETTPAQSGQSARNAGASLFQTVFQSAIDNVRETNAKQVDLEYKLATGQLDNPADLTLATANASNSALLLMTQRADAHLSVKRAERTVRRGLSCRIFRQS